ncbi:peptidoglycan-binding protein [Paenochrobactrum glaciei]|uniref:Peptidoglycan-binding protein n=1 Tax=Paenochrobactrum glaciei TaxID=486407 RepID=A0ABN1FYK7_9HYPH
MNQLCSLINHTTLLAIAPRAPVKKIAKQQEIIAAFGALLPRMLERFEITTALRIPHFLAQVAHESDGFCTIEEYASGAAYEGRKDLGNTQSGDGRRFKGRAPIQLTGRDNYRAFTVWMGKLGITKIDFEANPELVATWPWAAWATFYYWSTKGLNKFADNDDLIGLTKRINGGLNGLQDRSNYLITAKEVVANIQASQLAINQGRTLLRRGMRGNDVASLQYALREAGYYHLTIDGIFGAGTEQAVRSFQREFRLVVDGLVGRKTQDKLHPFKKQVAA